MDAIITAGGTLKPDDPLYELTRVEKKALIPLAGQPMICWVIDALCGSGIIEHTVIVGLEPHELEKKYDQVYFTRSVGDIIDNLYAGTARLKEVNPKAKKALILSSDIPLITPETIRGFVEECGSQEAELYYAIVEEKTMETRFPASKRTFVPFKGGRYSGGDIFLAELSAAETGNKLLVRAATSSRKNYFEQVRLIGLGFIIRFLLRMMTVEEAARRVAEKVNLHGYVVDTKFAELGMDLDKAHQYEIIKANLESRQTETV